MDLIDFGKRSSLRLFLFSSLYTPMQHFIQFYSRLAGINAGDVRLSCRIECLQHSWYLNLDTVQSLDPITGQYMSYKPLLHRQWGKRGSGGACPHKILPAQSQVHATGA